MEKQIILVPLLFVICGVFNALAQDVPLAYDVENRGAECPVPPLPSFSELPTIESLPDPFAWSDPSRGRITSYADWRVTETLEGKRETLSNAQGAPWYRENLSRFNEAVTKLPYDHHELMAMVAPRALFVLGNPDYE